MATPNPELFFAGRLNRIILNTLTFEMFDPDSADGAIATITNNIEVGIKSPEADAYFVAITVTVVVNDKNDNRPLYNAKAKMSGLYKLENAIGQERTKELAEAAVKRGTYQVYPLVRRLILETMNKAGVGLKEFPYEPPSKSESVEVSRSKHAAKAKAARIPSRQNRK